MIKRLVKNLVLGTLLLSSPLRANKPEIVNFQREVSTAGLESYLDYFSHYKSKGQVNEHKEVMNHIYVPRKLETIFDEAINNAEEACKNEFFGSPLLHETVLIYYPKNNNEGDWRVMYSCNPSDPIVFVFIRNDKKKLFNRFEVPIRGREIDIFYLDKDGVIVSALEELKEKSGKLGVYSTKILEEGVRGNRRELSSLKREMRREITEIKAAISALSLRNSDLSGRYERLEERMMDLEREISQLSEDVSKQIQLESMRPRVKKVVIVEQKKNKGEDPLYALPVVYYFSNELKDGKLTLFLFENSFTTSLSVPKKEGGLRSYQNLGFYFADPTKRYRVAYGIELFRSSESNFSDIEKLFYSNERGALLSFRSFVGTQKSMMEFGMNFGFKEKRKDFILASRKESLRSKNIFGGLSLLTILDHIYFEVSGQTGIVTSKESYGNLFQGSLALGIFGKTYSVELRFDHNNYRYNISEGVIVWNLDEAERSADFKISFNLDNFRPYMMYSEDLKGERNSISVGFVVIK